MRPRLEVGRWPVKRCESRTPAVRVAQREEGGHRTALSCTRPRGGLEWHHHSRRVMTVLMATMVTKKVMPNVAKDSMIAARCGDADVPVVPRFGVRLEAFQVMGERWKTTSTRGQRLNRVVIGAAEPGESTRARESLSQNELSYSVGAQNTVLSLDFTRRLSDSRIWTRNHRQLQRTVQAHLCYPHSHRS